MYSPSPDETMVSDEENEPDSPNSFGGIMESDKMTSEYFARRARSRIMDMPDYNEDSKSSVDSFEESGKEWFRPKGTQPQIGRFKGLVEMEINKTDCVQPEEFFELLVPGDLLQEIADETNNYVSSILKQYPSVRLSNWFPTSKEEIKKLFALILWMGMCKLPNLALYWSKDPFFDIRVPDSLMSQGRFEILLRMVRFTDSRTATGERLDKMKKLVNTLNENFQKYCNAKENVCIDESIIPFRRSHSYKRYIKQKRHKFGFSIFKLCSKNGYTHSFRIYDGKNLDKENFTPKNVVLTLSESVLEKGRTIYANSWFTSLDLAMDLIMRNTHLVGPIRSNSPGLDEEVVRKELKRGEIFGKEHKTGITLLKWRDKREALALSTKHSVNADYVNIKGRDRARPVLILDYLDNKSPGALSDENIGCCSPLRKILKWHLGLALELILNTAVVNAWILYNMKTNAALTLLHYKKKLVLGFLLRKAEMFNQLAEKSIMFTGQHTLENEKGKPRRRNRCRSCYAKNVKNHSTEISRIITKKVSTFCAACPKKPFLCRPCFNELHFI